MDIGRVVFGAGLRGSYEVVDLGGLDVGGRESSVIASVPLVIRVKTATSFRPNLGVAPFIAFQSRSGGESDASATLGGAAITIGADLRLGPGRPFLDVGYRLSTVGRRALLDASVEGAIAQLGYRIELGE